MTSIRPHTFLLIIAILLLFLTSGCQKSPINGDLDGQWQVMEVSPAHAETPIDARLYYCFYLHVCQLNYYGGTLTTGSMDYSGDHITLSFPDTSEETAAGLRQYGIPANPVTFTVNRLDSKSLILRSATTTVTIRKF